MNKTDYLEIAINLLNLALNDKSSRPLLKAFDRWVLCTQKSLSEAEFNSLKKLRSEVLIYIK